MLGGGCVTALGGGAAAKKGQGKEKAKMFTEEKVSGKYDGEVKPMLGWPGAVNWGGAGPPTQQERKPPGCGCALGTAATPWCP